MFTHILVPVDGSDHAVHALQVACDMAEKYGASLHLFHAYPTIIPEARMITTDIEALLASRKQAGEEILKSALEHTQCRVANVTTELREAPDAEAILEEAKRRGIGEKPKNLW